MLASTSRSVLRSTQIAPVAGAQARNMATLREIQARIKAITSISKVTKSMKMIASTKLARAQRSMNAAREYGQTTQATLTHANVELPANLESSRVLTVAVSGDRGLCGGVHSSVSKGTKGYFGENPNSKLVVLGDKAKTQLQRTNRDSIELTFNQIGKKVPNYGESLIIADTILNEVGTENFDVARVIYNYFTNAISYEAQYVDSPSQSIMQAGSTFSAYETESETVAKYREFMFANVVHWALVEGHAVEISSKRNAMENATKNANDMISTLTLKYNRGRQASITNELIDIITGASSL
ncbi:ATP synthase F1, gamma subunit [Ramicandelaber brevisporus]|nr:ATP synthase F1, gamma subunit [Ramicandelaber brevisporus]